MRGLENTAQQKLLAYQLEHAKRADFLIGQLKEILQAYQLDGSDSQRVDAIDNSLEAEVSTLLAECEEHMAYAGRTICLSCCNPTARSGRCCSMGWS